jgi:ATP-dependent helicase/nuclease subunit B
LPTPRPEPRPAADARPKKLSATKITKLMRDPYVIYASEVLKLKKLDDIDQDISAADFGNFIHNVLEEFCKNYDGERDTLIAIGKDNFKDFESREGAKTFWWPKFLKIADWFIVKEKAARDSGKKLEFEIREEIEIGGVKISSRADRVEIGEGITIIDYKTGTPPSKKDVSTGIEPQLTVEALIFESLNGKKVDGLEYWKLDGKEFKETAFDEEEIEKMMESTRDGLTELIALFSRAETPYIAVPRIKYALEYNDYQHLERIKEWQE